MSGYLKAASFLAGRWLYVLGFEVCEGKISDSAFAPEPSRDASLVIGGCATLDRARQIMINTRA